MHLLEEYLKAGNTPKMLFVREDAMKKYAALIEKANCEIFEVTDDVRGLINSDLTSAQLRKRARELGMRTLREDGIRKVMAGLTSAEEIIRVTTGDAS